MDWISERQSLADEFAERAQNASQYLLSSRASRRLHEEGDEAAEEIIRFRQEIEKRYLLSVSNKYYSFPYTELSFDNPAQDKEISDLVGKGLYCLYVPEDQNESVPVENDNNQIAQVLENIKEERRRIGGLLEMIKNRRNRRDEGHPQSKEKKLGFKYGVIHEEQDELLRKRLYTEPYQKPTGFIMKKK